MAVAQPLRGVTVLDFGQVYNGPYCGFLLAQAGARVIKVESPVGETLRGRARTTSASYPFALLNGGKECMTLNIKSAAGQKLLKELVAHVDVVLENFSPGTLAEYGLGSDQLCAINPRLVYAASTGYGGIGPYRDYLGMDITIQAMSGVMSVTGEGEGPPLKAGAALCDFLGGVHLYAGIVSALYQREQTGRGAVLDISMQDCVFPTLTTQLGAFFQAGEQRPRTGNRHAALSAAPYNVYEAKDGHVAMICIRDGHWRNLCQAMQRPELAEDERFADMKSRAANMDELDATIEAWTVTLDKDEIFAIAQEHDVICAPVQNLRDVVDDRHMHERGTLHRREHPTLGDIVLMSTPLRFQGLEAPEPTEVAPLGAHTDAVLGEILGLESDDISALRDAEAI
jgi:crotonobetainyl-CoA:carnitine CoA-transferase CaiB-like acyl-CoA transferase